MKLYLNDKPIDVKEGMTLTELLAQHFPDQKRVAIAIDDKVVPKQKWEETILKENDKILILEATAGG